MVFRSTRGRESELNAREAHNFLNVIEHDRTL